MIPPWSPIRELAVVDVGNGENVVLRGGVHGHQREHDQSVDHKSPLDTLASAIGGAKQRGHAIEEQHDEHAWSEPSEGTVSTDRRERR